jgi:uncharacterized repeat protein (TIGR03803 family)
MRIFELHAANGFSIRCAAALVMTLSSSAAFSHAESASAPFTFTTIYSFTGNNDGGNPIGNLFVGEIPTSYGTTSSDGVNPEGTIYSLRAQSGVFNLVALASFQGSPDGAIPIGDLVADQNGVLYGITNVGGTSDTCGIGVGCGTIFSVTPPALGHNWREATLYSFKGGRDGSGPWGGLVRGTDGALYGTTTGDIDSVFLGTVFQLSPPSGTGGSWTETVLYNFTGIPDGAVPLGKLVQDSSGTLYGTTNQGGEFGFGTVFALSYSAGSWNKTTLYSFAGGNDGAGPVGTLALSSTGALYGTTFGNSNNSDFGNVFELDPPSQGGVQWTEKVLYNFGIADGHNPTGDLALDSSGRLYGTTLSGGGKSYGAAFLLIPPANSGQTWTEKILYRFQGGSDGASPRAGLVLAPDGSLYGTTQFAGTYGYGTIFKITR